MKLGLFGGSFDPLHCGHLVLAEKSLAWAGLQKLFFIPSGTPPHRQAPLASSVHRRAMIEVAIRENPLFELYDYELKKNGAAYTYQTVRQFKEDHPGSELYFLLGADSILEMKTWKNWGELVRDLWFVVGAREGVSLERLDESIRRKVLFLEGFRMDLSSSAIRQKMKAGQSIRGLVPEAVEKYIREHELYRD